MAIPHASIARLSSFMMLLDPDPAGEITASLSRDTRGMGDVVRRRSMGDVVRRRNLHETYIALLQPFWAGVGCAARKCLVRRLSACSESKNESSGQVLHCGGGAGPKSVHLKG